MAADKLIRMANQIAAFFRSSADSVEEGERGVADHLIKFWAPSMRSELLALSQDESAELDDLVRGALVYLQKRA